MPHKKNLEIKNGLNNTFNQLDEYFKESVHNQGRFYAVLSIHLFNFQTLISVHSYKTAGKIQAAAFQRINNYLAEGICAPLNYGEFVVIVPVVGPYQGAAKLSKDILSAFIPAIEIDGEKDFFVDTHVGISLYPEDSDNFDTLLRYANLAANHSNNFPGEYSFFRREMLKLSVQYQNIDQALRIAFHAHEFELYYQPKVDLKTQQIIGVEALLRWPAYDHAPISPEEFIPILEDSGLISQVGQWVLNQACDDYHSWQTKYNFELPIAVNLAAPQFHDLDLHGMIRQTLFNHSLQPNAIEVEITESGMMQEPEKTLVILRNLHELGIKISIDDFGTGYSSLSYLQRFPLNYLKLDKTFINGLPDHPGNASMVKAVLAMSKNLNLKVIAEGIENKEQADFLLTNGCHIGQGYYFGKPMPAEEIANLLHMPLLKSQ